MRPESSLSATQRTAAVDLFEEGFGYSAVSSRLGVSSYAVEALEKRFKIWGRAALERRTTNQAYALEFKMAVVQEFLAGQGSLPELALRHQISSPKLLARWVKIYRDKGEDGLHIKRKGRPRTTVDQPPRETSEVETLRGEIQRLQAENAYLKKVRALRNQAQP